MELNPFLKEGLMKADIGTKKPKADLADFHFKKAYGLIPPQVKHIADYSA